MVLWQAYRSLATSDTSAPQEIEAVLGQIEKTMTAEQVAAIEAMDLGQEDLSVFLEAFRQSIAAGDSDGAGGFFLGQGGAGGEGGGFTPPDGVLLIGPNGPGGGAGGPAFGGGGGGAIEEINPEMLATAQAVRGSSPAGRGGLFLLGPLIAELQALAGEMMSGVGRDVGHRLTGPPGPAGWVYTRGRWLTAWRRPSSSSTMSPVSLRCWMPT